MERPFGITYDSEVVIPVKVRELNWRSTHSLKQEENWQLIKEELDFLEKKRCFTALTDASVRKTTTSM